MDLFEIAEMGLCPGFDLPTADSDLCRPDTGHPHGPVAQNQGGRAAVEPGADLLRPGNTGGLAAWAAAGCSPGVTASRKSHRPRAIATAAPTIIQVSSSGRVASSSASRRRQPIAVRPARTAITS